MQNEEQRIFDEVNKRKARARQSGVIETAFKLYRDDLPYYDAWAKNCPEVLHPQIRVVDVIETPGKDESAVRVDALIRDHRYTFTFRDSTTFMPDGEPHGWGALDVDFEGQRVMTIDCGCQYDQYIGTTWHTIDVSSFIEGPWVSELNQVYAEVARLHQDRDKLNEERAKKQKLQELKKNFGL